MGISSLPLLSSGIGWATLAQPLSCLLGPGCEVWPSAYPSPSGRGDQRRPCSMGVLGPTVHWHATIQTERQAEWLVTICRRTQRRCRCTPQNATGGLAGAFGRAVHRDAARRTRRFSHLRNRLTSKQCDTYENPALESGETLSFLRRPGAGKESNLDVFGPLWSGKRRTERRHDRGKDKKTQDRFAVDLAAGMCYV
jgi:hypothetical protein